MTSCPPPVAATGSVRAEFAALFRDSSRYLLGLLGTMALGFISFPIFTRVLPVADYGMIDLAQKILLVVTALGKFGLPHSALRFYDVKRFAVDRTSAVRYYSTMFFGTAAPAFAFSALFIAAVLLRSGRGSGFPAVLIISAFLVLPRALQGVFWSFLRVEQRTTLYNIVVVALKAATILAICVMIRWRSASAEVYFSATVIAETLLVIGFTVFWRRQGMLAVSSFDFALFRAAFAFGVPLVLNEVAFVVLDAADRTLVQHYLGAVDLGIYAVAYGLAAMIQSLLLTPLNLAVVPMYLQLWDAGEHEKTSRFISTGVDLLLLGGAGLFVIVCATARELVLVAASAKYLAAADLIPMIFAGLLIFTAYVFVNAGLMVAKKTARIAVVMSVSAVVNIALNCALLPRLGLRGAALATLVSYTFCTLALAVAASRFLPLRVEPRRVAVYLVAAVAAWAASRALHPETALLGLLVKGAVAGGLYVAIVYLADPRIRHWLSRSALFARPAAGGS